MGASSALKRTVLAPRVTAAFPTAGASHGHEPRRQKRAGSEGVRPYGITRPRMSSTLCSIRLSRFFRAFSSSLEREEPPLLLTVVREEDDIDEKEPSPS